MIDENTKQCVTVQVRKMDVSIEQRYAIKFSVRLKKITLETVALLHEVFNAEILGGSTIR